MKNETRVLLFLLFAICQNLGWSQSHSTFEIKGKTRIVVGKGEIQERAVEADSVLIDHLIVTDFRKDGSILVSTKYRFAEEVFNLNNIYKYAERGSLQFDGERRVYRDDELLTKIINYRADTLESEIFFYDNGRKMALVSGSREKKNGMFVMWHPNGAISFKGTYRDNKKEGVFSCFDEKGHLLRKGVYQSGNLVEGEVVVQDLLYENPTEEAEFTGGISKLNDYLIDKTKGWLEVKQLEKSERYIYNIPISIDKDGQITNVDVSNVSEPKFSTLLRKALSDFPPFRPATIEDTPVTSIKEIRFELDSTGLSLGYPYGFYRDNSEVHASYSEEVFLDVEAMPEFPGGLKAFQKFIEGNLCYPPEAKGKGIQGKVYVKFLVTSDGRVANVEIAKSEHDILNEEAKRVVRKMPLWKPGYQRGKPVQVMEMVPVNFVL